MPDFYESLSPDHIEWILKQAIFFTASAPLTGKHINVSPKGFPSSSFSVLGPNLVAYIDATGSGCETIAHIYENGRVTIMFNSFDPSPRIMRLFCKGRVVEWDQPQFNDLMASMGPGKRTEGARAIIVLDVWKVQTSCGYGVPLFSAPPPEGGEVAPIMKNRDTLSNWAKNQIKKGEMKSFQAEWNSRSLDGLPSLKVARKTKGERVLLVGDTTAWLKRVRWDTFLAGIAVGAVVGLVGTKIMVSQRF